MTKTNTYSGLQGKNLDYRHNPAPSYKGLVQLMRHAEADPTAKAEENLRRMSSGRK